MVDVLRDDTPTPTEQRITELWAWIAVQPDGGEGIISAGFPVLGHMPLITSKHRLADGPMREMAEKARRLSLPGTKVELRYFPLAP